MKVDDFVEEIMSNPKERFLKSLCAAISNFENETGCEIEAIEFDGCCKMGIEDICGSVKIYTYPKKTNANTS